MWKKIWQTGVGKGRFFRALVSVLLFGMCGCSNGQEEILTLERAVTAQESESSGAQDKESESNFVQSDTGESSGALSLADQGKPGGESESSKQTGIFVHVCGAVVTPGVVEVAYGSRAQAALEAAGGFTKEADTDFVNLAKPLTDGEQLYIPTKEEGSLMRIRQEEAASTKVNLNTAGKEELCTLTGIGEGRAGDIIAYRQEHGSFDTVEEIMQVPGIKESTYNKIKDKITVE